MKRVIIDIDEDGYIEKGQVSVVLAWSQPTECGWSNWMSSIVIDLLKNDYLHIHKDGTSDHKMPEQKKE